MTIWMDLTNCLTQHKGNATDIVRAELMFAKYLHELYHSIRFSVLLKQGFKKVPSNSLKWLWKSKNIDDGFTLYQKRRRKFLNKLITKIDRKLFKISYCYKRHHRPKGTPRKEFFVWPFQKGDVIFSCACFSTPKEHFFYKLKDIQPNLKLIYMIYDSITLADSLKETYSKSKLDFDYLRWIFQNCNAVVYGDKATQIEAEKYFREKELPVPMSLSVQWGNDISDNTLKKSDILEKFKINAPFILLVGSFDWRKNFQVLYRAYCWAKTQQINLPQLVIVKRKEEENNELSTMFLENPLLKDKVKIISTENKELDILYENCLFTILPSPFEGWSFNLPKSLTFGKLCLCSDVPPMHETGKEFAYYINPYHPIEWAKAISDFSEHPEKVKIYEQNIKANWNPVTWKQAAKDLGNSLTHIAHLSTNDIKNIQLKKNEENHSTAKIYYDLGLIFVPLTGIPRTQMILARYLYHMRKDIEFFNMVNGNYYYIPTSCLSNLLSDEKIDVAVEKDKTFLHSIKKEVPFEKEDIVFSTGTFFDVKTREELKKLHKEIGFKFISTIFDFTPLTVPHTHPKERVDLYPTFLRSIFEYSDFIIYGGKTAQSDGENFQKENNLPITPSLAIKWGNDLVSQKHSPKETRNILHKCGITGDYILTVGTVEARKNHRILYDAYLELLQDESMKNKMPQLIICGHPGWRTKNFVDLLNYDERIKDKIILFSPTDEELDVLYQNCKFTCLASIYEGWSLTLPESLNYGKFCLSTDTPSLKETGIDIVDYANPYDPEEWAAKIKFYCTNKDALKKRENLIKEKWHNTTWKECAIRINEVLNKLLKEEKNDE